MIHSQREGVNYVFTANCCVTNCPKHQQLWHTCVFYGSEVYILKNPVRPQLLSVRHMWSLSWIIQVPWGRLLPHLLISLWGCLFPRLWISTKASDRVGENSCVRWWLSSFQCPSLRMMPITYFCGTLKQVHTGQEATQGQEHQRQGSQASFEFVCLFVLK